LVVLVVLVFLGIPTNPSEVLGSKSTFEDFEKWNVHPWRLLVVLVVLAFSGIPTNPSEVLGSKSTFEDFENGMYILGGCW
jgi:hypothetical protein